MLGLSIYSFAAPPNVASPLVGDEERGFAAHKGRRYRQNRQALGSKPVLENVNLRRLRIVCYPEPVLREHCQPVTEFGTDLEALTARMLELMYEGHGVGLAAPQVGLALRLFVCNATGQPEDARVCVNPELIDLEGMVEAEEGCLSLPEVSVCRRRAQQLTMTACDVQGREYRVTGVDLDARIWQHENDHLDGRMIIDDMPTSAELANRRILKQLKDDYRRRTRKTGLV